MRHKILGNVFFGIMAVFLICVIVIISAIRNLYGVNVVTIIMDLKYQLLIVFVISVVLAVVLSALTYKSIINPINAINVENPNDEVEFEEIRPLVDKINTQNRQIKQQMDELKAENEKQNSLRREFTANVSHELKTPLTSISGYAEIMRNGVAKPEDINRFSGIIYDETQRLITLVGDIINLSKLDEKEVIHEKKMVNLYEISQNVISRLNAVAAKKRVTFKIEGNKETVYGVVSIIDEIIYNLCDNAIKYNKEDGLVIINIQKVDGITEYTVTDTGIGIAENDLDRVFERFYRADKSHSRKIGGTGLGLSIVKHVLEAHGESINLRSELGKGSTFSFTLSKN